MKTILVHQVHFHHFFFLALNTSEQSGQCCRPFWLHTVHSSAPQRFLVPFLVPRHHRHGTKPRPSHVRHGPSPSAFYSTRRRKSTSVTHINSRAQIQDRNCLCGGMLHQVCVLLASTSNPINFLCSCPVSFSSSTVLSSWTHRHTQTSYTTHGHTHVRKHCTITTSYKAHERGVQQILVSQDVTHHSPQCALH